MIARDPVRDLLRGRGCPPHVVDGGLDGLLAAWTRLANELERGYPLGLDDYLDDLDARALIEDSLAVASRDQRTRVARRLRGIDARVRAATEPAGRCLWGERVARGHGWDPATHWWYYARPRRMGEELRREIGGGG